MHHPSDAARFLQGPPVRVLQRWAVPADAPREHAPRLLRRAGACFAASGPRSQKSVAVAAPAFTVTVRVPRNTRVSPPTSGSSLAAWQVKATV